MNQRRSYLRKLAYMAAIAVLLLPLSWLSRPSTKDSEGRIVPGGVLAQQRDQYQISQSSLGEIDPASETMKLATLGLRGVAANQLWGKAHEYKKKENWTALSATLEQIAKLQPNVVSVWRFQAWNLSYNVSVEFDRWQDRYYWVIKGINFLKEGISYNSNEPMLVWDLGWFISQKIGRSDERQLFRAKFKEDDDFHGKRPRDDRDNWLVGREYYLEAEKTADRKLTSLKALNPEIDYGVDPQKIKGVAPLVFYSNSAMCLINYADVNEDEGDFSERARDAWRKAGDAWTHYGSRDIPSTYGVAVQMNDRERQQEAAEKAKAELDKLTPSGLADKLMEERRAQLTEQQREAWDTAPDQRTEEQAQIALVLTPKMTITPTQIAEAIEGPDRSAALVFAEIASQADFTAQVIDRYREIVNFDYWRLRCKVEQDDDTLAARQTIYNAEKEAKDADLESARALYEQGFALWRKVIDKHPEILTPNTVMDDLNESITDYRYVRKNALKDKNEDPNLPNPFVLQDVLDRSGESPNKPMGVPITTPEKK